MGHGNDTVIIHVDLPYSEKILESVALVLVLLASSFLNITTCAIIARNKLLRTRPANVFVANLCLSNLVLTWFVIPFSLATLLWNKHDAYSGPACTFNGFFSVAGCSAIVLTLCCISIDRYIAVNKSTRYRTIMTTKRALYMTLATWLQSLLFASLPVLGWSHYEYHPGTLHCSPSFSSNCSLYIFLSIIGFIVPIVVMVITYIKIFQVIRRHSRIVTSLTMMSHAPVPTQRTLVDEVQGEELQGKWSHSHDSQSSLLRKTRDSLPRKDDQSPPLSPSSIITTNDDGLQPSQYVTQSYNLTRDLQLITQSNKETLDSQYAMQTNDVMRDSQVVILPKETTCDSQAVTQSDDVMRDSQVVILPKETTCDSQAVTQSDDVMRDSQLVTQSYNTMPNPYAFFEELRTTGHSGLDGALHGNNDNIRAQEESPGVSIPSMRADDKGPQGTSNDAILKITQTNLILGKNMRRMSSKEYKIAKTGLLLLVLFLILWLPYLVVNSCSTNINAPARVFHFAMWLVYMNGVANPIAYAFNNTIVKTKLKQVFHRTCHPFSKK